MAKGLTFINDKLYEYLQSVSLREPDVLLRLRKETLKLGSLSGMQISPDQGQFMQLLAELIGAQKILEVGAFTGYSSLALALTLPNNGKLITCDISREWTEIAHRYWQEADVMHKIELRLGPAQESLTQLIQTGNENSFDLMFIDADKTGYDAYYEYGLKLVRPGGLILIDNVLWGGSVVNPKIKDPDTDAIRALNQKLHTDSRIRLSMLPIGDGLTLARRL